MTPATFEDLLKEVHGVSNAGVMRFPRTELDKELFIGTYFVFFLNLGSSKKCFRKFLKSKVHLKRNRTSAICHSVDKIAAVEEVEEVLFVAEIVSPTAPLTGPPLEGEAILAVVSEAEGVAAEEVIEVEMIVGVDTGVEMTADSGAEEMGSVAEEVVVVEEVLGAEGILGADSGAVVEAEASKEITCINPNGIIFSFILSRKTSMFLILP
ncbi:hypothetical protein JTB14_027683 [Gonioctena quinquepunctata]|nr:hypothetical protein JTB14_027683 [Gonioctena quinquepunctata]